MRNGVLDSAKEMTEVPQGAAGTAEFGKVRLIPLL